MQQVQQMHQMPSTYTMPTMQLPAQSMPGLPAGMKVRITLKNAKIKAEKVIIKVVKE
jgi:CO dehydrogenase/acetyl-CoA synthase beta subunit